MRHYSAITSSLSVLSLSVFSFSVLSLSIEQAYAQTSEQTASLQQPVTERIVVTASKQGTEYIESEQSLTLLSAEDIEQARVRDFKRIDDLAPNIQFNESGQRGSVFITVRGVESNPFIVNRAAVYIDGIPFRELSNSVLTNVDSIEVLRGPQGTLYGANTESGLIVINTKPPEEFVTGNVRTTLSRHPTGYGRSVSSYVAGPLINNTLLGSLNLTHTNEDAFVKNLAPNIADSGHIKENFANARLRWTPTDRLTINTTTYWLDMDAPGLFHRQYVPLNRQRYDQLYGDYNGGQQIEKWATYEDAPKLTTEREWVAGISASYLLNDARIELAGSIRDHKKTASGLDFDLTAAPFVAGQELDDEQFTNLEVRYIASPSTTFNYIVGASYYDSDSKNTKATFLGQGTLASYIKAPQQQEQGEDVGVFASANWYVTPKLKLSAGARYERAQRATAQQAGQLDLGAGSVVRYSDVDSSKDFTELLPKFAALYRITDDFSVHVAVAKGYIPGGFNLTAFQDGYADPNITSYDSESLWSHEVGFKWRASDRSMRASGALFYINAEHWQELQIATDSSGRPVSSDYIGSNASMRSRGAEFEFNWKITDGWSFDAHLGYVDAEYTDLELEAGLNVAGQAVQFVPEYDAGMALRYAWSQGWYARAEAGFTGKTSLRSRGDIYQAATTTIGLQAGYEANRYDIRVFVDNLTDERRASGLAIENLMFGNDGLFYAPLDSPRVVGVEATWHF